ncbi:conserved unknown protein [Ectocarpus siliculosus]|uniref:EF-hand domain-containing protein n=1 Tax=Ectocarpus siliculosus TaxID=2880 RepID=D8LIB4_ECTSI|nr:conserved unknown protein [Ectocarpus siliculosus]|eukprot:CBN79417.1 conserved unknown protein [Ectocarpus siliculosus]
MASLNANRGAASASTVYDPYKIFQAAQRCMGDPSVVAKVLVELLGDCATPDVLMASAASVLEIYYGGGGLRKTSMTDFGKFAGELADELGARNSTQAEEKMKEAQSVYELFEEADTDNSGTISKQEFCVFGSNIDVSSDEEALELFARVDTDKNGVISFLEWLQFCVPGPGRDPNSFNCAGQHGLQSCAAPADDTTCNWCGSKWPAGSRMFSCRECDCDACLECAILHLQSCDTRIFCERAVVDPSKTSARSCAVCEREASPASDGEDEEDEEAA